MNRILKVSSTATILALSCHLALGHQQHGVENHQSAISAQQPGEIDAVNVDWDTTAMLIVDPQVDTLSEEGAGWALFGEQVTKHNIVNKLVSLRDQSEAADVVVLYSRVEVTEQEYESWTSRNGLQSIMADLKLFVPGKGGDFIDELQPTEKTVVLSARKGPSPAQSDLFVQLHQRGLDTIVIAGMAANLCVESHVRQAVDAGFNVIVVGDAIASVNEELRQASLNDFSLLATDVVDTSDVLISLQSRIDNEN